MAGLQDSIKEHSWEAGISGTHKAKDLPDTWIMDSTTLLGHLERDKTAYHSNAAGAGSGRKKVLICCDFPFPLRAAHMENIMKT